MEHCKIARVLSHLAGEAPALDPGAGDCEELPVTLAALVLTLLLVTVPRCELRTGEFSAPPPPPLRPPTSSCSLDFIFMAWPGPGTS